MRLKTKPVKPSRSMRSYSVQAGYSTLDTILDDCRSHLVDLYNYTTDEAIKLVDYKDITVETEWDYDCETVSATFSITVSDHEFDASNQKYLDKLAIHSAWCKDNKDAINDELDRRANAKKVNEAKTTQANVDRLTKELAINQKKLKSLTER